MRTLLVVRLVGDLKVGCSVRAGFESSARQRNCSGW
jgi:hypothetical protein